MITYYMSTENTLYKSDTLEQGCWIYAVAPTDAEIGEIAEKTGIESDVLKAALDEEERARIELDEGVTLVVFDTPIASKDENNVVTYSTIPVGVISTKNYFIT
ncbi:MAG: magnesium transporter CorA family protein, partial [Clostridia bacterium]|nr:magnesium transporter CorA family protein [Clostridia bacterium]